MGSSRGTVRPRDLNLGGRLKPQESKVQNEGWGHLCSPGGRGGELGVSRIQLAACLHSLIQEAPAPHPPAPGC